MTAAETAQGIFCGIVQQKFETTTADTTAAAVNDNNVIGDNQQQKLQ